VPVDLNSDLGETVDGVPTADDAAMFRLITSANVACGFHAGDAATMLASCRLARENGVSLGAHVSYDDPAGFGRRDVDIAPDRLRADVTSQLRGLGDAARAAGTRIRYVKPHGALYNRIVTDTAQADAVADAVRAFDRTLPLLGRPDSAIAAAAASHGLAFRAEAFVDRAYLADGSLVPRSTPGSVLADAGFVAERALRMVRDGTTVAVDGTTIRVRVDSLCVHGDSHGAVAIARAVRETLAAAGVQFEAFA
jgi:UPF0271 protein